MAAPNCENKYITLLDLSRQSKIITGDTACFDGKIQAGLPFSGYPTGVDIETIGSTGIVPWPSSGSSAIFSSSTTTTIFDVANPLSPFFPIFSGITGTSWNNPIFSAETSGLTLPITLFSAETQTMGPFWEISETGMTDDHIIATQMSGYTLTYSFYDVESPEGPPYIVFSGGTTVFIESYTAGTLDYRGPVDYLRSRENATIENRLTTKKLRVTGGASASTIGYVLKQIDEIGSAAWRPDSGITADTNTFVVSGLLDGSDDLILTYNTAGIVPAIDLSDLRFTGNTSGDCITDLFVTNLYGCSPITVHDSMVFDGCDIITATTETIVFGRNLTLSGAVNTNTYANVMLGGLDNVISAPSPGAFVNRAGILGGNDNIIHGRAIGSFIIGSDDSESNGSNNQIIGGANHTILFGFRSAIIGGSSNTINDSDTAILAGVNNTILVGADRSVILGGDGINATAIDTAYVPNLNIGTIGSGSPSINLGLDSSGNVVTGTTAFTGNTSGDCITDLYITNLYGCSPITVHDNIQHISSSATGINSIAWGTGTTASGNWSHAEGFMTIASGTSSHAEGAFTRAYGILSHAEGFRTSATTYYAHAEGDTTIASEEGAHAEGEGTAAMGHSSHAEGTTTTAMGHSSHAEGRLTTASGDYSHAGGNGTKFGGKKIISSGDTSFVHFKRLDLGSSIPGAYGDYSAILGGNDHNIGTGSTGSAILGGSGNTISDNVIRSVILGGENITGTTDDTVYVPNLNIGTVGGGSPINNLGIDSIGNVVTGTAGGGITIDPYNNVGSASTLTWDVSGTSTNYEITLTGNTTLTMSNVRNGDYGTLIIHQDVVGGWTLSFTIAFGPHLVVNGGGGTPTLTATAGATDILSFTYNGTKTYWTVGPDYT